jgi:hypothetical protein
MAKAEEFLVVAEECLGADRFIAATGTAVHAAISAADAVCGARTASRSAGQDHDEVLGLLRQAGPEGSQLAKQLARLLPLKVRAEYDPDEVSRSTATRAGGGKSRRHCPRGDGRWRAVIRFSGMTLRPNDAAPSRTSGPMGKTGRANPSGSRQQALGPWSDRT